jgi:signal transduction histidine kinase
MRSWSVGSPRSTWLATALLAVLLVTLAFLQYRWIGEVSRAERQRLRAAFAAAADRFADDLGRDVTRALFTFQPGRSREAGGETSVGERWRRWRETAAQPELVSAVYVVEWKDQGGAPELRRVDPASGESVPAEWPPDLLPLGAAIRAELDDDVAGAHLPFPLDPRIPALIAPLHRFFSGGSGGGARPRQGLVIAVLDRRFLAEELFPELAERSFGVSRAEDYLVGVVGPGGLVYRSDPRVPAARYLPGDIAEPLLGLHRGESRRRREHGERGVSRDPRNRRDRRGTPSDARSRVESPWRLVVTHRAGSLEEAVERVRRRNLAVSLGVLALLTAALAVLAASAQEARRLARRQIEFVAGVTHELNTPLAAIRSAGQNLADGVVADPGQVKRYGALIESEGRRLSGMVAKALELAGIQSGNKTYRPEPVALGELVDEALSESRWVLGEKGIAVEKDVPADLPAVRWIGVRARAGRDGREVSLTVEDRGPGIHPDDRPHLFEPFYRGREVSAGAIHGSGLGLYLARHAVEAHRGTLSVATGPGGSAFTFRLPAAPLQED